MPDNPKILVGCPTYDGKGYCLNTYLQACKSLTYQNKQFLFVDNSKEDEYQKRIVEKEFETLRVLPMSETTTRQIVANCRNLIRKKALDEEFEYFLSLEQDVIPPQNIIEQLLKHSKKIVAGVYYTIYRFEGQQKMRPLMWKEVNNARMAFMTEESKSGKLLEVRATGLGCMLIHREVLEKLKFYINPNESSFDDVIVLAESIAKQLGGLAKKLRSTFR